MINHRHTTAGMYCFRLMMLVFTALSMAACGNDDDPQVFPIRFPHNDYTIMADAISQISFVDGTGQYDIIIGNPDVISQAKINQDTQSLSVTPAGIGESTLTINDIPTGTQITLNITVTYFHLTFNIVHIEGLNTNPYLKLGADLTFTKEPEGRKALKITYKDPTTSQQQTLAQGLFDIIKGDSEFTVEMSLHGNEHEEFALYTYASPGEDRTFDIFNHYFGFGWEKAKGSRLSPVSYPLLILNDPQCTIGATLQPYTYQ